MAAGKNIIPPKWKTLDRTATIKIVITFRQSEYATLIIKEGKQMKEMHAEHKNLLYIKHPLDTLHIYVSFVNSS